MAPRSRRSALRDRARCCTGGAGAAHLGVCDELRMGGRHPRDMHGRGPTDSPAAPPPPSHASCSARFTAAAVGGAAGTCNWVGGGGPSGGATACGSAREAGTARLAPAPNARNREPHCSAGVPSSASPRPRRHESQLLPLLLLLLLLELPSLMQLRGAGAQAPNDPEAVMGGACGGGGRGQEIEGA
eukprot:236038-Chlamydomonas_euryale.AAC.2